MKPLDVEAAQRARDFLSTRSQSSTDNEAREVMTRLLSVYDDLAARYAYLVVALTGPVEE